MPKFLYCLDCYKGIKLELSEMITCKEICKNIRGKYVTNEKAEICAKIPEKAFFIGIRCNSYTIAEEILCKNPDLRVNMESEMTHLIDSVENIPNKPSIESMIKDSSILQFMRFASKIIPLCQPEKLKSIELRSAIEESDEWKQYEKHKIEFFKLEDEPSWKEWKKGCEARTGDPEQWNKLLEDKGYAIGTVISLKNREWPEIWEKRWVYNDSLCNKFDQKE